MLLKEHGDVERPFIQRFSHDDGCPVHLVFNLNELVHSKLLNLCHKGDGMRGLLRVIIVFIEIDSELFGEYLKPLGLPLVVNQGYGKALQTECRPDSRYCGGF